jgi:hypothetical protein
LDLCDFDDADKTPELIHPPLIFSGNKDDNSYGHEDDESEDNEQSLPSVPRRPQSWFTKLVLSHHLSKSTISHERICTYDMMEEEDLLCPVCILF